MLSDWNYWRCSARIGFQAVAGDSDKNEEKIFIDRFRCCFVVVYGGLVFIPYS